MITDPEELFRLAFKLYLNGSPRGKQSEIARALDVEKSSISNYINRKKKFKEGTRGKIAKYIGYSYGDMINLGEKLAGKFEVNAKSTHPPFSFKPGVLELFRKKNNISKEELSYLLAISKTEYDFKEKGLMPFESHEIIKLMKLSEEIYGKKDSKLSDRISKSRKIISCESGKISKYNKEG